MRYIAFLAIILFAGVAFGQGKLKKTQISKEVTVQLPKDFLPMPDDGIAREYPATTKPLAVYTSPNGEVDFSVTQKRSQFKEADLEMLREFYKANLLETFTQIDFIRQEVSPVNGKNYLVFEFVSKLADERGASIQKPLNKYSIVQYTIKGDQLYIFTMHVPFAMKNDWQETARKIMASISIK